MKAVELFAGAGGLGIGVSNAGFQPTLIAEWDRWCCDTIQKNRAKGLRPVVDWPEPHQGDVRLLDFAPLEGKVDLVSGGPPCQPFSLGGRHRGDSDPRDMWPHAVRAIRQIRPRAFLFENVKGLTRNAFARYFNYIYLQLTYPSLAPRKWEEWHGHASRLERHHTGSSENSAEYRVIFSVVNAADYGVPQRRERLMLVGFRSDLGIEWSFPKATHSLDSLLWNQCRSDEYWEGHRVARARRTMEARLHARGAALLFHPRERPWRTVRDATSDLPDPEFRPREALRFLNHKFQPGARSYPGHTGSPLDEPAKALKAGVHGVPGGENMLVREDGSIRYFSVRESARLQAFPDAYTFDGSWSETMRQLGNAVPVTLSTVVAKSIGKQLRSRGTNRVTRG